MRRYAVILASVLILVLSAYAPNRPARVLASGHLSAAAKKKVCKTITKKVHGKKKKVKVCHTVKVKPNPTATPTDTPTPTPTPTNTSVPVNVTGLTPIVQAVPPASFPSETDEIGAYSSIAADGPVTAMAVGDLNKDGNADLVVLHASTNTLSVLTGDGKGGFKAPADYATGKSPSSVSIGDLNGDGFPDLVAYNAGDNSLDVYFNKGDGTFTTPPTATTALRPHQTLTGLHLLLPCAGEAGAAPAISYEYLGGTGVAVVAMPCSDGRVALFSVPRGGPVGLPTLLNPAPYVQNVAGLAFAPQTLGFDLGVFGTSGSGPGVNIAEFPITDGQVASTPSGVYSQPQCTLLPGFANSNFGSLKPSTPSTPSLFADLTICNAAPTLTIFQEQPPPVTGGPQPRPSPTLAVPAILNGYQLPPSCTGKDFLVDTGLSGPIVKLPNPNGSECIFYFDENGNLIARAFLARPPASDPTPAGAQVAGDPELIWFDAAGSLYAAPVTTYGGSALVASTDGSTSDEVSGTVQAGTAAPSGLDLLGAQLANLSSPPSISGLPGATVTLINGGIHIAFPAPVPASFDFHLSGLQPFDHTNSVRMFGTDAGGVENVWFNTAIQF